MCTTNRSNTTPFVMMKELSELINQCAAFNVKELSTYIAIESNRLSKMKDKSEGEEYKYLLLKDIIHLVDHKSWPANLSDTEYDAIKSITEKFI